MNLVQLINKYTFYKKLAGLEKPFDTLYHIDTLKSHPFSMTQSSQTMMKSYKYKFHIICVIFKHDFLFECKSWIFFFILSKFKWIYISNVVHIYEINLENIVCESGSCFPLGCFSKIRTNRQNRKSLETQIWKLLDFEETKSDCQQLCCQRVEKY